MVWAARARERAAPAAPARIACAGQASRPSTAALLFYAKIELLFFIGPLYLPDASFAPHQ
ncbi:hypothetical protein DBB31_17435 [Burkholderia multivorans]|nr:hypothetical protein DBB31_17435 [Burkholderia multivorans]